MTLVPDLRVTYQRKCQLCGGRAFGRRKVWLKTMFGWEERKVYICFVCWHYWVDEYRKEVKQDA